jgi:hypothetical protein
MRDNTSGPVFPLSGQQRAGKNRTLLFSLLEKKQQPNPRSQCKTIAGIIPKNLF